MTVYDLRWWYCCLTSYSRSSHYLSIHTKYVNLFNALYVCDMAGKANHMNCLGILFDSVKTKFAFTCLHLADAFNWSDLRCVIYIKVYILSECVLLGDQTCDELCIANYKKILYMPATTIWHPPSSQDCILSSSVVNPCGTKHAKLGLVDLKRTLLWSDPCNYNTLNPSRA